MNYQTWPVIPGLINLIVNMTVIMAVLIESTIAIQRQTATFTLPKELTLLMMMMMMMKLMTCLMTFPYLMQKHLPDLHLLPYSTPYPDQSLLFVLQKCPLGTGPVSCRDPNPWANLTMLVAACQGSDLMDAQFLLTHLSLLFRFSLFETYLAFDMYMTDLIGMLVNPQSLNVNLCLF